MNSSIVSLVLSNLVVIVLAVVQRWNVSSVLWVYWMQSIIIGFFQFLRILSLKKFSTDNFAINGQPALPTRHTKLFTAYFFAFHYGFFHFVYAILLFNFFRSAQPLNLADIFLGGSIFSLNHFFSYQQNKAIDSRKIPNIGRLMFSPYSRIIPMHLIIVFGAMLGASTLVIFLLLKTLVDVVLHIFKHRVSRRLL